MPKIVVNLFFGVAAAAFGVVAYEGFTGLLKQDNITIITAIFNCAVVLGGVVLSYKSFGKDVKTCLRDTKEAVRLGQENKNHITSIVGYLRNFGSRLRKLDGIESEVRLDD